jgi:putative membrane protein
MTAKKFIRHTIIVTMVAVMLALNMASAKPVAQQAAALNSVDVLFVNDAAMSNVAEIMLAQIALQEATDSDVRAFAQQMITEHTAALTTLVQLATAKGITLPTGFSSLTPGSFPSSLTHDERQFDITYMSGQVLAHERSIDLFEKEAARGSDPDLRAYAQNNLPDLQEHLRLATKTLRRAKRNNG